MGWAPFWAIFRIKHPVTLAINVIITQKPGH
jgi:hypothetical protein